MQSIELQLPTDNHRIQISGFLEQCDLVYDKILAVLFALCYMTYSLSGNFFNLQSKLETL